MLSRRYSVVVLWVALLALTRVLHAQTPEWIWGDATADTETRYFRKTVTIDKDIQQAILAVACDNRAEVFIDDLRVARNNDWNQATFAIVTSSLGPGEHRLSVKAVNEGGQAGLLLRLELKGASRRFVVSDSTWETSVDGASDWKSAKSLGPLGTPPWGDPMKARTAPSAETLTVLKGFKVELVRSAGPGEGSWVAMTFDPKGRLIVSPQGSEPMLRISFGTGGVIESVEPIELPISGAMGLLCAFDSLYANAQGPEGYHLYRLRDTDGNDRYDRAEIIRKWKGGPGEHGAHGIVLGPGQDLFTVEGNFVDVPEDIDPASPHRNYRDDLVLKRLEDGNGFGAGRKPPGGYVVRMEPDGSNCQLLAAGERNTYDIAFNADGELFGFDSDMEWDWGTPWYRPTRVFHIVSGADHGFREGSAKWPTYYQDSLPEVVDIGIGSPTGVRFGTGARFPGRYRDALYVMDWSYGRILAVHLQPQGASYTGTFETFVKGKPLNVTDLDVGPDGALYFTIGGRGTQGGLYRVTYIGEEPAPASSPPLAASAPGATERQVRRHLEESHGKLDPSFLEGGWKNLSHADRAIRYAARIALESQPVSQWRTRALGETHPLGGLTALLALARVGTQSDQAEILKALARWPLDGLTEPEKLLKLRVIEVCIARHGLPDDELLMVAREKLGRQFPASNWPLNRELSQLLVALGSPEVVKASLKLRDTATTQEEQVHYQAILRLATNGWTLPDRKSYFEWFHAKKAAPVHPVEFVQWFRDVGLEPQNGASYANFLKNIRQQAAATLPDSERRELAPWILGPTMVPASGHAMSNATPRRLVKQYTVADLTPSLGKLDRGRNFTRGWETFHAGQCVICHRFNGEGGASGPDLTGLSSRYSRADVLKSLIEPSAIVSEQYQNIVVGLANGEEVTGRLVDENTDRLVLITDPLTDARKEIKKSDVKSRQASQTSAMPDGLLDTFAQDEILDLMAYLEANGQSSARPFFE